MQLQAVKTSHHATLDYIASYQGYVIEGIPSKEEFLNSYNFDEIMGSEGDALSPDDEILCSDGVILGSDLLN